MPDVIDPQVTQVCQSEVLAMLTLEQTALLAATNLEMVLLADNFTPTPRPQPSDLVEASFTGYARQSVSAMNGPYVDTANNCYLLSNTVIFTATGSDSQSIYGSALIYQDGGTQATATNPGNSGAYDPVFTITNPGTQYQFTPKVHLTGATGSGATAHAVVTDGIITAIILDNPGSGYTTYTVTIDPPSTVAAINKFAAPVVVGPLNTALPTYQEISVPPVQTM